MAFVTGMMLIEAPASALNNAGAEEGAPTDNTIAVKRIRGRAGGDYPYVSAQAVRYWLRTYLEAISSGLEDGSRIPRSENRIHRCESVALVGRRSVRLHARAI